MTLRSSSLIMGLLLATAATSGMLACSSSEEAAAEEAAPAPERAMDETQPAPLGSNTNSAEAPPADPDPAPATDGGTGDGGGGGTGTGPGTGGGTGTGAGKLCEAASVKETEDNNSQGAATAVPAQTGSACGQLATKADVDFFKFTLPADTTGFGMGLNYSRQGLKIEVSVDGKSFEVGQTPELVPGKEYVVKVSTTGDGPVDYRWSMQVEK